MSADGTIESGLNLQIALRLNDLLRLLGQQTQMTRKEDISIHSEEADTLHESGISPSLSCSIRTAVLWRL